MRIRQFLLLAVVSSGVASVESHCSLADDCLADDKPSLKAELPRIKAVEPAKALATFEVQAGFQLELIAHEPLVSDPVDACFDSKGRMFVVEMHGYPFSQEPTRLYPSGGGKKDAGIVRLLEDSDNDGKFDKSTRFADAIRWPTSVVCFDGGVFVLAPPALWYFKDTNNDGKADIRIVIYDGFSRDNVQGLANNLKWGIDNRIYLAAGRNPSTIRLRAIAKSNSEIGSRFEQLDESSVAAAKIWNVRGGDISFDPRDPSDVRRETGGLQFGHSMDDWGHRFVCSNSNHIQQILIPDNLMPKRSLEPVRTIHSISAEGPAAPVFRRSSAEPWRIVRTRRRVADPRYKNLPPTERVPIGFFTSATGITLYRGDAWPSEFRGQVFIGDVGGNLVHRKSIDRSHAIFRATRADTRSEFIASTDNWFRPTNFVNAPDGTLYVLDMYRETIEHPFSIPADIKRFLDLESGDDRGRVYRILGPNGIRKSVVDLDQLRLPELLECLNSNNAWCQETARRILFERGVNEDSLAAIGLFLKHNPKPLAKASLLWLLQTHGLFESQQELVTELSSNASDESMDQIMKIQQIHDDGFDDRFPIVVQASHAASATTRLTAALTMAQLIGDGSPTSIQSSNLTKLQEVFQRFLSDADPTVRQVARGSAHGPELSGYLIQASVDNEQIPANATLLLATILGGKTARKALFKNLENAPVWLQSATLIAANHHPMLKNVALGELIDVTNARAQSGGLAQEDRRLLGRLASKMKTIAHANHEPTPNRIAAVRALAVLGVETARVNVLPLLSPRSPTAVQVAVVEALLDESSDFYQSVVERWASLSPAVRSAFFETLFAEVKSTHRILKSIQNQEIAARDISVDRRQFLVNHANSSIAATAKKLFANDLATNRAAVVKQYQAAASLEADVGRGAMLFKKNCMTCHRVGREGHAVGPDIVSVQNKSAIDLLISILDPNRESQSNFTSYTVITRRGKIHNGIIVEQNSNSITVRRAEGKSDTILRKDVDELISSGKSLMPEGLEKELKRPQDVADVIGFIKSLRK